jgi:small subunit ribosomal protein S9
LEDQAYFYGTGRRKTAIARVKIMPGRGAIVINGIPYEELLTRIEHRSMVTKPLIVTENLGKYNVVVTTVGGGTCGAGRGYFYGHRPRAIEGECRE